MVENDPEAKGRQALDMLHDHVTELVEFASETLGRVRFSDDDHFAFMTLCFASRQIEHANSILRLNPHRDCTLVARCMAEGLIQLFWAAKSSDERAL
jgi:hypothetical protein